MSRFFSSFHKSLIPYVPGEQPRDMVYIKLNTNESPYAPGTNVAAAVERESASLRLYSDPECTALRAKMAEVFGLRPDQFLMVNGSDEILQFAFWAFADAAHPLVFPDITYGCYPVFADLHHIPYRTVPLNADFTIPVEQFLGTDETVVIANPNAPTGLALPLTDIVRIVESNPNRVVIVDEAYVDFGAESAAKLVNQYDNLLVTGTFSKSRSMAGARLGFGIGNPALLSDINAIKYSTNPYNVNRLTAAAGIAALEDNDYYMANCRKIIETRAWTVAALRELGFAVENTCANFVFAKHEKLSGEAIYLGLKQKGVLVRHFTAERIRDYNRITIGTQEQMETMIRRLRQLLEENA